MACGKERRKAPWWEGLSNVSEECACWSDYKPSMVDGRVRSLLHYQSKKNYAGERMTKINEKINGG